MVLIFLHIPKAAGTTLNQILVRNYSDKKIFTIGVDTQAYTDWFKVMPEEEKAKLGLVKGHMTFGLHEYISKPCTYITMLRDPIDRVISSYYYVLRTPIHYLHEQVKSSQMSLEDFVSSGIFTDLDNGQTRRLAGVSVGALAGKYDVAFGDCSRELLEEATKNILDHFVVVGLQERFDESLLLMQDSLQWDSCFYVSKNIGTNRPKQRVEDTTLKLVKEINALDVELYEFAERLFEQQISARVKHFQRRLDQFQALNQMHGQMSGVSDLLRSGGRYAKALLKLKRVS